VLSPFTLQAVQKGHAADGGHRTIAAETTVRRLEHLIDPVTGIVTGLHRSTPAESALHVYTAGANPVFLHHDLSGLRAGLRRASSGKGFSDAQARASALGEALERYSASSHGDEPVRLATVGEMLDSGGVDPRDVMLYSDAQYATRGRPGDATAAVHDWVPEPIAESSALEWSPVWSLTEERRRYLPTALLYIGHRGPGASHSHGDSNGCAAGNTREEALLQGLCELVERDAVAMWWYNRLRRPALELTDFDGAEWDRMRSHYARAERELWLLDVTNDLRVPTIVAVSRYAGRAEEEILVGLGTHLDVEVAAMRALSEMNQMFAALEIMRQKSAVNPALTDWLSTATVENQPYLLPAAGPSTRAAAFARVTSTDVADDVRTIQAAIESKGSSLLVCDQTRAEVGLPVVKAIAPGLRHFRQRFAPGRLYDVPVSLGWRATACLESELNPIAFFL
jgi:ribosomal protein S12 methylthiotransferase accessory factor